MTYNLQFTDTAKTAIAVAPLTTDTTSTDLTFVGRGVANYGESQQTNFLRLLENFSSVNEPANPIIGQIWYDPSVEQLKVCINNTAVPVVWSTIAEMSIIASLAEPTNKKIGMVWYDFTIQKLKVWNGTVWVIIGADATTVSATAPSGPVIGQLWFNLADNILYVWNGTQWLATSSGSNPIQDESWKYYAFLGF